MRVRVCVREIEIEIDREREREREREWERERERERERESERERERAWKLSHYQIIPLQIGHFKEWLKVAGILGEWMKMKISDIQFCLVVALTIRQTIATMLCWSQLRWLSFRVVSARTLYSAFLSSEKYKPVTLSFHIHLIVKLEHGWKSLWRNVYKKAFWNGWKQPKLPITQDQISGNHASLAGVFGYS